MVLPVKDISTGICIKTNYPMKTTHLTHPVAHRCIQGILRTPQQEILPATQFPEINTGLYFHSTLSGCRSVPDGHTPNRPDDTKYRHCVYSPTGAVLKNETL